MFNVKYRVSVKYIIKETIETLEKIFCKQPKPYVSGLQTFQGICGTAENS